MSVLKIKEAKDAGQRALVAYYKTGGSLTPVTPVREFHVDGRRFIVLEGEDQVLAVYRVRPVDTGLRRIEDFPAAITTVVQGRKRIEELEAVCVKVLESDFTDSEAVSRSKDLFIAMATDGFPRPSTPAADVVLSAYTTR